VEYPQEHDIATGQDNDDLIAGREAESSWRWPVGTRLAGGVQELGSLEEGRPAIGRGRLGWRDNEYVEGRCGRTIRRRRI
jgi:hypothetical protein